MALCIFKPDSGEAKGGLAERGTCREAFDSRRQNFTEHCAYKERISDMKIYALEVIILPKFLCSDIISLNPMYICGYKEDIKPSQILMS